MTDNQWNARLGELTGQVTAAVEALTELVHDVRKEVSDVRKEVSEVDRRQGEQGERLARIEGMMEQMQRPPVISKTTGVITIGAVLTTAALAVATAFATGIAESIMEAIQQ